MCFFKTTIYIIVIYSLTLTIYADEEDHRCYENVTVTTPDVSDTSKHLHNICI